MSTALILLLGTSGVAVLAVLALAFEQVAGGTEPEPGPLVLAVRGVPEGARILGPGWAQGPDAFVVRVDRPPVVAAIAAIEAMGGTAIVAHGTARVKSDEIPDSDPRWGPPLDDLVGAIERELWADWQAIADRPGFSDVGDRPLTHFQALVEGARVDVRATGNSELPLGLGLKIRAQLRRPLEGRCLVMHRDAMKGSAAIGDPILDTLLAAQGDSTELRERLGRDEVRALLLELLHPNPDSSLSSMDLHLVIEAPAGDPGVHLDRVLELLAVL